MKILLINPPCGPRTIGMRYICRLEPLNLEQSGAAVSKEHEVRLVDMQVRRGDLEATLAEFRPDVAGNGTETVRVHQAKEVLRAVKKFAPQCVTVVGGHHPTLFPDDFDDPAVDLIVRGEGYHAFGDICREVASGRKCYDRIPGLRIRTGKGFEETEPRGLPTVLDDIPPPDRSLTARYRKYYYYMLEPQVALVRTSYGCRSKCSFCPGALVYGQHFIPRDPQAMFAEIRSVDEAYIKFADNGSFQHAESMGKLARLLIDGKVKKRYYTFSRADAVVENPELFEVWKRAGLRMVFLGGEALDDESLRRLHKGISLTRMERAIAILEQLRIPITAGFVIPPDAGEADFRRFDEYIQGHPMIEYAEFAPLTPFPGTEFYQEQRENILTHDAELYDMQHFVVKTRLPQQELYRLMMRSYRKLVFRTVWREWLWMPVVGVRNGKWRLLRGLLANKRALTTAHLGISVPEGAGGGCKKASVAFAHR